MDRDHNSPYLFTTGAIIDTQRYVISGEVNGSIKPLLVLHANGRVEGQLEHVSRAGAIVVDEMRRHLKMKYEDKIEALRQELSDAMNGRPNVNDLWWRDVGSIYNKLTKVLEEMKS